MFIWFWLLVILALVVLWVALAPVFKLIGTPIVKMLKELKKTISEKE